MKSSAVTHRRIHVGNSALRDVGGRTVESLPAADAAVLMVDHIAVDAHTTL
jgi:hypothetical protein